MTEASTNDTIKSVAAAITAVGSGMGSIVGLTPGDVSYTSGLIVAALTSLVSIFYAVRRIRAGSAVAA